MLELCVAARVRFAFARADDERLDFGPILGGQGGTAGDAVLGYKRFQASVVLDADAEELGGFVSPHGLPDQSLLQQKGAVFAEEFIVAISRSPPHRVLEAARQLRNEVEFDAGGGRGGNGKRLRKGSRGRGGSGVHG
jgi:hypothetical protein